MDSAGDYPNSNVTSTHLSDIQLLSQVFTSSNTLSVLDISFNSWPWICECKLGPAGADKIGEMLYHNNSIVSIDLGDNEIEDSGVEWRG